MKRIFLLIAVFAVSALGSVAGCAALDFYRFLNRPLPEKVLVDVGFGWSLAQIADTLEKQGVVTSARWFVLLARFEQIQKKRGIQAGEYLFAQGETPESALVRMTKGQVVKRHLVIPEGLTVAQIGARMKAHGWKDAEAVLADPDHIRKLAPDGPSLEGWLFPSTYHYRRGDTALEMLTRMVKQSRRVVDELWKTYRPGQAKGASRSSDVPSFRIISLSRSEVMVLASIIEKETGQNGERGRISAVFHNRLRKKMRMQSDPTVIYGLQYTTSGQPITTGPVFDGNLTRKHLRTSTPYNTYTEFGLPPTPICNPGKAAIRAAMHPDPSEDLFFVARGEGSHAFSKTLKEHEANVDRYQRRRTSRKKWREKKP